MNEQKIKELADLIQADTMDFYSRVEEYDTSPEGVHFANIQVHIKPGKKYTKIDLGTSGKYMIDADGNIFGIKGYGVIHRGHQYGTLDTINDWYWGGYVAIKKQLQRKGE